jgi:hypothetical protein
MKAIQIEAFGNSAEVVKAVDIPALVRQRPAMSWSLDRGRRSNDESMRAESFTGYGGMSLR